MKYIEIATGKEPFLFDFLAGEATMECVYANMCSIKDGIVDTNIAKHDSDVCVVAGFRLMNDISDPPLDTTMIIMSDLKKWSEVGTLREVEEMINGKTDSIKIIRCTSQCQFTVADLNNIKAILNKCYQDGTLYDR